MSTAAKVQRIPEEQLAELWFSFKHQILDKLQTTFRSSGLKQIEIAAVLGKQEATISRCLSGKENMTLRTMHDLARGMNCRLRIEIERVDSLAPVNRQHGETWKLTKPASASTSLVNSLSVNQEAA